MTSAGKTLAPELRDRIDADWRAANYLSVGQIYLRDNPLLKRPLQPSAAVSNLDRFDLAMDAIAHLPQTSSKGLYLKRKLREKLVLHSDYLREHGEDMPQVRNCTGGEATAPGVTQ